MKKETRIIRQYLFNQGIKEENFKKSGIYRFTSIQENIVYIGSARVLINRLRSHIEELMKNIHGNDKFQESWNKYGIDNFKVDILEFVDDISQLSNREQYYFDKLLFAQECIKSNFKDRRFFELSFNKVCVAINCVDKKEMTDEMRYKFSIQSLCLWQRDEYRDKMLKQRNDIEYRKYQGIQVSKALSNPETRLKLSNGVRASRTAEFNAKMKYIMTKTDVHEKLVEAGKKIWENEEYRKKQIWDNKRREKLTNSLKEKWEDEEYRNKLIKVQNDPLVNKKRSETRKKTQSKEDYTNDWFIEVYAENSIEKMTFKNTKLANEWIYNNKPKDLKRGIIWSLRWLLENNIKDFLNFHWSVESDKIKPIVLKEEKAIVTDKLLNIKYEFDSIDKAKIELLKLFPIDGVKYFPLEYFVTSKKCFRKHLFFTQSSLIINKK